MYDDGSFCEYHTNAVHKDSFAKPVTQPVIEVVDPFYYICKFVMLLAFELYAISKSKLQKIPKFPYLVPSF